MPRSQDVAIFVVTTTTDRQIDRQTKPIPLPLVHARGVMKLMEQLITEVFIKPNEAYHIPGSAAMIESKENEVYGALITCVNLWTFTLAYFT